MQFRERFERLRPEIWTDAYLPAWSSRAQAAATYRTGADGLELLIPPQQRLWCPDLHPSPLRVSAVQSANRSGPVGSTDAPQPFLAGQVVREHQPTVLGFVPHYGSIAVACAATLGPRSMFSAWMVGLEEEPERCGEICLMEVFGNTVRGGQVDVGQGIHPFRDPSLEDDFAAESVTLDIAEQHTYGVDWQPDRVVFRIDGRVTRVSEQSPDYPMMLILGLFDFPDMPGAAAHTPVLKVSDVSATKLGPGTFLHAHGRDHSDDAGA